MAPELSTTIIYGRSTREILFPVQQALQAMTLVNSSLARYGERLCLSSRKAVVKVANSDWYHAITPSFSVSRSGSQEKTLVCSPYGDHCRPDEHIFSHTRKRQRRLLSESRAMDHTKGLCFFPGRSSWDISLPESLRELPFRLAPLNLCAAIMFPRASESLFPACSS